MYVYMHTHTHLMICDICEYIHTYIMCISALFSNTGTSRELSGAGRSPKMSEGTLAVLVKLSCEESAAGTNVGLEGFRLRKVAEGYGAKSYGGDEKASASRG